MSRKRRLKRQNSPHEKFLSFFKHIGPWKNLPAQGFLISLLSKIFDSKNLTYF